METSVDELLNSNVVDCVLAGLQTQLGSSPVSPLGVVTDLVVQLHSRLE